jgi:two-component system sensor histidine kinase UhpB
MDGFSILVVERDDDASQILNCLQAPPEGKTEIHTAESLEEALRLLSHQIFDIILVDPELEDSQGIDTIRRLIKTSPDSAIIVISDYRGDERLAIRSVRFGAQDYIEKQHLSPFSLEKSMLYAVERKNILQEKFELLADLTSALEKVETLQNLLPLCRGCQKIYDETGSRWLELDAYLKVIRSKRSRGLCPDCLNELKIT